MFGMTAFIDNLQIGLMTGDDIDEGGVFVVLAKVSTESALSVLDRFHCCLSSVRDSWRQLPQAASDGRTCGCFGSLFDWMLLRGLDIPEGAQLWRPDEGDHCVAGAAGESGSVVHQDLDRAGDLALEVRSLAALGLSDWLD